MVKGGWKRFVEEKMYVILMMFESLLRNKSTYMRGVSVGWFFSLNVYTIYVHMCVNIRMAYGMKVHRLEICFLLIFKLKTRTVLHCMPLMSWLWCLSTYRILVSRYICRSPYVYCVNYMKPFTFLHVNKGANSLNCFVAMCILVVNGHELCN